MRLLLDTHLLLWALGAPSKLPINGEHAARVLDLPPVHRDPFDRLLAVQALAERMRLVTNVAVLARYGDIVTVV